jgi:glycosyltransferase involved in cell wall biosynthesis
MEERAPFFSVLAVTWRRTTYLRAALESVLHQTLERSRFEILLSKGVPDPALEAFCAEHGITVLFEESWDLGRRIDRALARCRGEVIVPLEDDDEFDPTKLAVLYEEFHRRPELAYVHNAFRVIGEDGAPLENVRFRAHTLRELAATGTVYDPPGEPSVRLRRLEPLDPSWNTSSIAFRRELLDGRREVLGRLAFLANRWIYLCSLLDRQGVLIDERPLTLYRLHRANTSGVGGRGTPSGKAVRELVDRVRSISDRQIADFEVLRAALIAAAAPELAAPIEERLPLLRFLSALRDPRARREPILRGFFRMVRSGGGAASSSPWAGRWISTLVLYGLTPLFVLSPSWGATAYVHLRELPRS